MYCQLLIQDSLLTKSIKRSRAVSWLRDDRSSGIIAGYAPKLISLYDACASETTTVELKKKGKHTCLYETRFQGPGIRDDTSELRQPT